MQMVLALLAVFLTGVGVAIETPTNALLTKSAGSVLWASLISFLVGAAVLATSLLVLRPKLPGGWMAATPWYAWVGGLYGAVVVTLSAWATPKLGAGTTLVVIIASQCALGVLLDHVGALGLSLHPAGWLRVAGVVVVAVGAVMIARG